MYVAYENSSSVSFLLSCSGQQVMTSASWANHQIQVDAEQDPSPHKGLVQPCIRNNNERIESQFVDLSKQTFIICACISKCNLFKLGRALAIPYDTYF